MFPTGHCRCRVVTLTHTSKIRVREIRHPPFVKPDRPYLPDNPSSLLPHFSPSTGHLPLGGTKSYSHPYNVSTRPITRSYSTLGAGGTFVTGGAGRVLDYTYVHAPVSEIGPHHVPPHDPGVPTGESSHPDRRRRLSSCKGPDRTSNSSSNFCRRGEPTAGKVRRRPRGTLLGSGDAPDPSPSLPSLRVSDLRWDGTGVPTLTQGRSRPVDRRSGVERSSIRSTSDPGRKDGRRKRGRQPVEPGGRNRNLTEGTGTETNTESPKIHCTESKLCINNSQATYGPWYDLN